MDDNKVAMEDLGCANTLLSTEYKQNGGEDHA